MQNNQELEGESILENIRDRLDKKVKYQDRLIFQDDAVKDLTI